MTHGWGLRPFSTAFLATRAAAIMTDGLDVLVHEVIEATVTAPFFSSNSRPSARVTGTETSGLDEYVGRNVKSCVESKDHVER